MGCYDVIFLEIECPYCKRKSKMEFQTKDMNRMFNVFKVGDKVPEEYKDLEYLDTKGCCNSPECQERSDKDWIIAQGSPSGFGLGISANVELKAGIVTGKIFDIKINENIDNFLEENRNKWEKTYKPRKKDNLVLKKFKEIK